MGTYQAHVSWGEICTYADPVQPLTTVGEELLIDDKKWGKKKLDHHLSYEVWTRSPKITKTRKLNEKRLLPVAGTSSCMHTGARSTKHVRSNKDKHAASKAIECRGKKRPHRRDVPGVFFHIFQNVCLVIRAYVPGTFYSRIENSSYPIMVFFILTLFLWFPFW